MESPWIVKKRFLHKEASKEQKVNELNKLNTTKTKNIKNTAKKYNDRKIMKILYTNIDQMTKSKKLELTELVMQHKPLIIAICEMKPKKTSDRTLEDYNIPDYKLFPVNLDNNIGRGIGIYAHSSIKHTISELSTEKNFKEACIIEIRLCNNDNLLFGCFYRSPSTISDSDDNNANLNSYLRQLCNLKKYSHICLVGDFNYNKINWENCSTSKGEESKEYEFLETLRDCFLYQQVNEPTRHRGSDEPSLIDLILTNEELQVPEIMYHSPLGKSDHSVLIFDYNCYMNTERSQKTFLYEKADFDKIRNHLFQQQWEEQFVSNSVGKSIESLWNEFKSKLLELRDNFIKQKDKGPPAWKRKGDIPIDRTLQNLIKEKSRTHRKLIKKIKQGENEENEWKEYKKIRNQIKNRMRYTKIRFERDITERSSRSPKVFWSYVRSKLKTKCGIAPLLENPKDKSSIKYGDGEKAAILQKQFCSVFTKEPAGELPRFDQRTPVEMIAPNITQNQVIKKINELKADKAFGPAEIHPKLLKELVDIVSRPLTIIFNKSLEEGMVPSDWKHASVSPIFKKGARNIAVNYRPISLTSIVCKILESIIKEHILSHLINENLITKNQYGFIPGRSTTTQLLHYLNSCIETMVEKNVTDAIYFDFSKAFDTVPHRRLLHKLENYGIKGATLRWISSFLNNHSQVVKVNGTESDLESVVSGIPQGSVLGPILFVIYINDLPECVRSSIYLFADDTKILKRIQTKQDSLELQEDANALGRWSRDCLLEFNLEKCHVLTLGRHQDIKHANRYCL